MTASDMASNTFPWLTIAIFVPIVFGLLVLALGRDDRPGLTRGLSLVGALAGFLVTIPLYTGFDTSTAAMQFVEQAPWIEEIGRAHSELQSLMRISYAVFCLKTKQKI